MPSAGVELNHTEKLVIRKNIKLAVIEKLIIWKKLLFFFNKNPNNTIIIKLIYTDSIIFWFNKKSDIIIMQRGMKKASFLLLKQAPENNAIAYIAVKLSEWGITRVNTPSNMNAIIMKFVFSFNLFFCLIILPNL